MEKEKSGITKLAYLIHTFPLYSLTFVVDEIVALRRMGSSIDLYGVRKPPPDEYPDCYGKYASETTYALPVSIPLHLFRHIGLLLSHPIRYTSCLLYILKVGGVNLRQRIKLFYYFSEAVELNKNISSKSYDHLHVHFLFGGAIIAIFLNKLSGIRYSLTAHGTDFLVERFFISEKIKHAEFVRVGTKYNAEFISQDISPDDRSKLFVLPFGIDAKKVSQDKVTREIDQRKNQPVKMINIGRLVWQKGQKDLIEAVRLLKDKGIPLSLEIVGEGELRPELESLISRYGLQETIVLRGALPREEALEIMRSADIFAFSSVSEGFGIVLLEAMLCGLAVVAPNINGVPEIIIDGRTGSIYQSGSAEDLADKLEVMIMNEDKRKHYAKSALDDVLARFDQDEKVSLFLSKIKSVL